MLLTSYKMMTCTTRLFIVVLTLTDIISHYNVIVIISYKMMILTTRLFIVVVLTLVTS